MLEFGLDELKFWYLQILKKQLPIELFSFFGVVRARIAFEPISTWSIVNGFDLKGSVRMDICLCSHWSLKFLIPHSEAMLAIYINLSNDILHSLNVHFWEVNMTDWRALCIGLILVDERMTFSNVKYWQQTFFHGRETVLVNTELSAQSWLIYSNEHSRNHVSLHYPYMENENAY